MIIVNKKLPSDVGGIEVVLKQMLHAITGRDTVVLTYNEDNGIKSDQYDHAAIIQLDAYFPKKPYRWSREYKNVLKRLSQDHKTVLFHYPSFQPEFYNIKFNKKIVYYHADVTKMGIFGTLYQKFIATRFLMDADRIFVSNPNIIGSSPTLQKLRDRCEVLHFGIDENHFYYRQDNYRNRLLGDGEDKLLLYVGRMARYKGFHYILECLKDLDESYRLVVVSRDAYRQKDRQFIKENDLEKRITKISDSSYEELPYYYSSADMLLMPSTDRAEAFGIVAVEAMACSVPVITTELGTGTSYHNIDGVTGRIIPPNSSKELYNSVVDIIHSDLDKEEIRNRALDFSIEGFNRNFNEAIECFL